MSKKFYRLSIERELLAERKRIAELQGTSVNSLLIHLIEEELQRRDEK